MSRGRSERYVRLKKDAVWDFLNRRNMSQRELAHRSGITPGYLSQLLNGERCASPKVRERLMAALGVLEFDDLFTIVKAGDLR